VGTGASIKITHWFEVIGKVLQDPVIRPENVYNMDETGVMLSMLGSVKVLVGKDDPRDYRGAGVKRTMVTAIECISADGKSLLPMIIWQPPPIEATGPRSPPLDGTMRAPNLDIPTPRSAWSGLSVYLIPKPRILICDGFGTHETLEILEYCFENNIILCRLPSHTSYKL
jgi:hypothetical protein